VYAFIIVGCPVTKYRVSFPAYNLGLAAENMNKHHYPDPGRDLQHHQELGFQQVQQCGQPQALHLNNNFYKQNMAQKCSTTLKHAQLQQHATMLISQLGLYDLFVTFYYIPNIL